MLATQTHLEFAKVIKNSFSQWLRSEKITEYEQLCKLILLEKFRRSVSKEVSMYLHEKKVKNIEETAVLAENFTVHLAGDMHLQELYLKTHLSKTG